MYSVVMASRNDDYGGPVRSRVLKAVAFNVNQATKHGLHMDWIFVEWNPLSSDYLSYDLARHFGFRCYVVMPEVHKRVVHPDVAERMTFCQFLAVNVGIRRARYPWVICTHPDDIWGADVWERLRRGGFDSEKLYRAQRYDVPAEVFGTKYATMDQRLGLDHGRGPTNAAGDFLMFYGRHGFDERAACFSDIHVDGRFVRSWFAERTGGCIDADDRFYEFIGRVYKHDHPMIYRRTASVTDHHRGKRKWDSKGRTCAGPALYANAEDWGLVGALETEQAPGVWELR